MTTFQDPPPQSRRAVRQSERGETPEQTPAQPQPYSFDAAGQGSEAEKTDLQSQVPVAPAAPPAPPTTVVVPHTGRRVQLPTGASAADAASSLEHRVAPPATDAYTQAPLATQPPPEQPGYRVRDFSPEGRRSSATRDQFQNVTSAPPATLTPNAGPGMPPPTVATPAPAELDYQTALPVRSHSAQIEAAPDDAMHHTLTRRELRELRAAQEEQAPPLQLPESIDTLLNSGPIEIPTLAPAPGQSQALADAMAEFDQLTRARREAEARARDAQVASLANQQAATPLVEPVVPVTTPIDAPPDVTDVAVQPFGFLTEPEQLLQSQPIEVQAPPVAAPQPAVPVAYEPPPVIEVPPLVEPAALVEPAVSAEPAPAALVEPAPLVQPPLLSPMPADWTPPPPTGASVPQAPPAAVAAAEAPVDSVRAEPARVEPTLVDPALVDPVFIEPARASARPTGHWSVQAAMEDDDDPLESTQSRTVGTGTSAITTSALVLPSVPQASDLTRPFASTGEILMTGSIDLPHSLGSTGAHPHRIDNSDFEDDPLDSQMAAPDSAPVRAIRAVSTHTSTRGVIENKKPQDNRWLTRVIIGVSVLLVIGVAGLIYVIATHNI